MLVQNPLPCVLLFSSETTTFYCYSMAGDLLSMCKENPGNIISPVIGRDSNFNNCVVYIKEKEGEIVKRKLPTLELRKLYRKEQGTALGIFETVPILVVGDEAGNFAILGDPNYIGESTIKPILLI